MEIDCAFRLCSPRPVTDQNQPLSVWCYANVACRYRCERGMEQFVHSAVNDGSGPNGSPLHWLFNIQPVCDLHQGFLTRSTSKLRLCVGVRSLSVPRTPYKEELKYHVATTLHDPARGR